MKVETTMENILKISGFPEIKQIQAKTAEVLETRRKKELEEQRVFIEGALSEIAEKIEWCASVGNHEAIISGAGKSKESVLRANDLWTNQFKENTIKDLIIPFLNSQGYSAGYVSKKFTSGYYYFDITVKW